MDCTDLMVATVQSCCDCNQNGILKEKERVEMEQEIGDSTAPLERVAGPGQGGGSALQIPHNHVSLL